MLLQGCSPVINAGPALKPWIALIEDGGCTPHTKIKHAMQYNVSAVIIYSTCYHDFRPFDINHPTGNSIHFSSLWYHWCPTH